MLEGLPIMPALCLMLWHAYYAQNYVGIIDAGQTSMPIDNFLIKIVYPTNRKGLAMLLDCSVRSNENYTQY